MESNGKPGFIHFSYDANKVLEDLGGFETEPRGEVIIKGEGVMETYWLKGRKNSGDMRIQALQLTTEQEESLPIPPSNEIDSKSKCGIYKEFVKCKEQH